jgi:adenylosuccinate lyase
MTSNQINALSPLDGRYFSKTQVLCPYFSEAALIKYRVKIEILYLKQLSEFKVIRKFSAKEKKSLDRIAEVESKDCQLVKKFEKQTHHDVKAVEYFLRQKIEKTSLKDISSFIHFAITSEDINNLAYRLMIKDSLSQLIYPNLKNLLLKLNTFAEQHQALVMLARTHGQAAIPTTLGKELTVFSLRLYKLYQKLDKFKLTGKLNGAVGAYQAMQFSTPQISWPKLSKNLVTSLGFEFNELTTQINPPDDMVELFSMMHQINSILLGLNQDIWRYISDNWLVQKGKQGHVGSSTMPQKINPIEFENSEGNIVMANGMFEIFIRKLPVSRLQRDLSESTVLRNIGSAFGYSLLAYQSLINGLGQLAVNRQQIQKDLNANWAILSEAWQTLARKNGDKQAYEKAVVFSKNKIIDQQSWQQLTIDMDPKLKKLNPDNYLGLSVKLTKKTTQQIKIFLNGGKKDE